MRVDGGGPGPVAAREQRFRAEKRGVHRGRPHRGVRRLKALRETIGRRIGADLPERAHGRAGGGQIASIRHGTQGGYGIGVSAFAEEIGQSDAGLALRGGEGFAQGLARLRRGILPERVTRQVNGIVVEQQGLEHRQGVPGSQHPQLTRREKPGVLRGAGPEEIRQGAAERAAEFGIAARIPDEFLDRDERCAALASVVPGKGGDRLGRVLRGLGRCASRAQRQRRHHYDTSNHHGKASTVSACSLSRLPWRQACYVF